MATPPANIAVCSFTVKAFVSRLFVRQGSAPSFGVSVAAEKEDLNYGAARKRLHHRAIRTRFASLPRGLAFR